MLCVRAMHAASHKHCLRQDPTAPVIQPFKQQHITIHTALHGQTAAVTQHILENSILLCRLGASPARSTTGWSMTLPSPTPWPHTGERL